MPITRTKISGDYVKPSLGTCPASNSTFSTSNETRTRISGNYIKPVQSIFGPTFTRTPVHPIYRPTIFASEPVYIPNSPVYTPASHIHRSVVVHDSFDTVAGVLLTTALVVSMIALLSFAPICHTEEVCTNILGTAFQNCHLERVCFT